MESQLGDLFLELAGNAELKRRFLASPHEVLAERGIPVPEGVTLKVLEDSENLRHIVLPHMPSAGKHALEEVDKRQSKIVVPP